MTWPISDTAVGDEGATSKNVDRDTHTLLKKAHSSINVISLAAETCEMLDRTTDCAQLAGPNRAYPTPAS